MPAGAWVHSRTGRYWRLASERHGDIRRFRLRQRGSRLQFVLAAAPLDLSRTRALPLTVTVSVRDVARSSSPPLRSDPQGNRLFP